MPDSVTMNKQFCEAMVEEMMSIANLGAVQIEFAWVKSSTKAFDKIETTLMGCAADSEHIRLETIVDADAKSVKVMPYKKEIKEEAKKEKKEKKKINTEKIGDPPAEPIIYDSITLSFIEFFAFH